MKDFSIEMLKNVLKVAHSKFSGVNCGGCGAMAAILADNLKTYIALKDIRIKCRPGLFCNGKCNIDEVRPLVKENSMEYWRDHGVSFGHLWVEFKWKEVWYGADIEGVLPQKEMRFNQGGCYGGAFSIDEVSELSFREEGWNDIFDRNQIPKMREFISEQLT